MGYAKNREIKFTSVCPISYKAIFVTLVVILLGACTERDLKGLYTYPNILLIDSSIYEFSDESGAETMVLALRKPQFRVFPIGPLKPSIPYLLTFVQPRWLIADESAAGGHVKVNLRSSSGHGIDNWVMSFYPKGESEDDWRQIAQIVSIPYRPVSNPDPIDEINQFRDEHGCVKELKRESVKTLGENRWLIEIVCGQASSRWYDSRPNPFGYYTYQYVEISGGAAISFHHTMSEPAFDPDDETQWPGTPAFRQQISELLSQTKLTIAEEFSPAEKAKHALATGQIDEFIRNDSKMRDEPGYPHSFRIFKFTKEG